MKNCKECKNYMYLWDGTKFSHYCRAYPNFKVMGSLEDLMINDKCTKYLPKVKNKKHGMSLKELTLKRAGGSYEYRIQKEKEYKEELKRKEKALKNKHVCIICEKAIPANRKFCEECAPKNVKRRRELSRNCYQARKDGTL